MDRSDEAINNKNNKIDINKEQRREYDNSSHYNRGKRVIRYYKQEDLVNRIGEE